MMFRCLILALFVIAQAAAQRQTYERVAISSDDPPRTLKPLLWGRHYAVSSMRSKASMVAERILRAGGNAFDAAVAGQAVLGVVEPSANGVGSDAILLVYDRESEEGLVDQRRRHRAEAGHHRVVQEESRRQAPGRTTRCWRAPCPASWTPGTSCSRVGHHDLRGSAGAGDRARRATAFRSRAATPADSAPKRMSKYPISVKLYAPDGKKWKRARSCRIPTLARTLRRLVEAEQQASGQGREAALRAARDRFYKGDIAREMAALLRRERRTVPLRGFRGLHRESRRAGIDELPRLRRSTRTPRPPGSGRAVRAEYARRLRPEGDGPQLRRTTSTPPSKR